jgi:hypothetical protein
MSASDTLRATACLLGCALALQALELLMVRRELRDDGLFAWPLLREDHRRAPLPVRMLLDATLGYRPFVVLLVVQTALSMLLPWCAHRVVLAGLLLGSLAICVRFRGTYNGGSDAMTMVVLIGLLVAGDGTAGARAARLGSPVERAGLGYIAAQLLLSYALAGLAKLREPAWRRGRALPQLLRARQYDVPSGLRAALDRPWLALLASWMVIALECAFPIALWIGPAACLGLLAIGLAFHTVNALTLGLNRFLWAWLSAYPSLLFWSDVLAS